VNWVEFWATVGGVLTGAAAMLGLWERSKIRKRQDEQLRATATSQALAQQQAAAMDIARQLNEQLLDPIKVELADVRARLKTAEEKIDHLEDTNDHLVAFVYKLIGLARNHGYDQEILPADVPPGIHL
jgi:acetyl-CoA carboxylase carboxyltransferase component